MREQHGPIMQEQSLPRFGNYELVRRIDVGGMGEVYLARQRSAFGRVVAIKIIRSDLVHDTTARARFLREAEVSAHLKHEHILPLFEFGEDQGRLFLVTPYIEGGTLARRLQSGPLSLAEVRQLFIPLVQAVAYIHRRGVIHRDLKPTNILLDEVDGQVYMRLIDFGIASVQGNTASPPLTTAGNEVGTIAYMAPERMSGVAAPSNDIFSLGVILYQMLTGHFPVGQEALNLPQPLEYVVRRCIAIRPEDRFATAEEVLKNFERAYEFLITSSLVPPPAPPVSPDAISASQSGSPNGPSNVPPVEDASGQELAVLQQSGSIPVAAPPQSQSTFRREDYNAPTTRFDPAKQQGQPVDGKRPTGKRRGWLPLLSAITIIVLLAIIALGYYGYQTVTATSVAINFSPQTQVISQVFTLTADPTIQAVNVATKSIPAKPLGSANTETKTGPTSGQQFDFSCFCLKQSVAATDVETLTAQLKQALISEITQKLQRQMQAAGEHQLGPIMFADLSQAANPAVGSISKNVTVSLTEQGSVRYMVDAVAQSLARQLITQQGQQFGQNYMLLSSSIATGLPVVEGANGSGVATIKIAAGCVVEYQFPASQLQAIQNSLKSMKVNDARTYLAGQPGVDGKTVAIHFTRGSSDRLPGDPQQIKIIPLNPASLPPVQLQNIPAPTFTPSTDLSPGTIPSTASSLSPTPTGN
jgi:serine/threonine protein kinase